MEKLKQIITCPWESVSVPWSCRMLLCCASPLKNKARSTGGGLKVFWGVLSHCPVSTWCFKPVEKYLYISTSTHFFLLSAHVLIVCIYWLTAMYSWGLQPWWHSKQVEHTRGRGVWRFPPPPHAHPCHGAELARSSVVSNNAANNCHFNRNIPDFWISID